MALTNVFTVVSGGSGCVGAGIIREFLLASATVVAPLRSADGKQKLLAELDGVDCSRLKTPIAQVGNEESVASLATQLREEYGQIDHVVASVGSWSMTGADAVSRLSVVYPRSAASAGT